MSALNRKTLRDLWQMKGQAVAIALVIACGIALFVLSRSLLHSLELTQTTYYDRYHFADVFATLKRAPDSLGERIAEIPGVARLETRIVVAVNLTVEGLPEPAMGRIVSLPDTRKPTLNQLFLRRGRWLSPQRDDEVLASEAFTTANNLHVGDSVLAVINGRQKRLQIVGIALSPEYIYEIKPGDLLPDNRHFGVLWMNHEAISIAYNLEGAFNDVAISLMRGASSAGVIQRLDELIKPYGGLGAYARRDQPSHLFVDNEIEQNRQMGMIMPSVFLGVAAFLLNVVLSRIINLQREQIAALKAFGYSQWEVGWHYLKLVLLIVALGLCLGIPGGIWFGQEVTAMYAKLFHFPTFTYRLTYDVALTASLVSIVAATLGAWGAILRAVRLPPAEAMRPEPPTSYGLTVLERMKLGRLVPPVVNMIIRQLERHPIKTSLSVLAISLAVAIVVVGNFMEDSVDYVLNAQFRVVQRYDMSLATFEPVSDRAIHNVASMPGVIAMVTSPIRSPKLTNTRAPDADSPSVNIAPACGPATWLWYAGWSGRSMTALRVSNSTNSSARVPTMGTACGKLALTASMSKAMARLYSATCGLPSPHGNTAPAGGRHRHRWGAGRPSTPIALPRGASQELARILRRRPPGPPVAGRGGAGQGARGERRHHRVRHRSS